MTLNVVDAVSIHLMPIVVLRVVAQKVADLKGSHVAQVGVQEGRFRADDGVNLAKRLHCSQVGEVYVCWDQVDVP